MGLFSGAPAGEKKQESDTWQNLNNLFSSTYSSAVGLGERGKSETGQSADYYKKLVSGDRTAIAPEINATVEGADAAKREQAQMGTARGGGASSFNQQVEDHTRAMINALMGEQQSGAADKLAAVGSGDTNAMMSALGIASGAETNLSNLLHQDVSQKNASAAKMWGSLISGGLNLATAGISGGFGGLFGGGGGGGGSNGGWNREVITM